MGLRRLVLTSEHAVIVWRLCRELCRTGIYHLIGCYNAVGIAHFLNLILSLSGQTRDHVVRELNAFCLSQKLYGKFLLGKALLHLHKNRNLIDEPVVNHGNLMNFLIGNTTAQRFRDHPNSTVIYHMKLLHQLCLRQFGKIVGLQTIHMLLQRTDCLHQRTLKVVTDTHNLSGSLHLCAQGSLGCQELVKRQSRNLYHTVVQHRLKAGIGLLRNGILNLVQCVAQRNLRRHLGNRVTGGLGSQRGRTGYTRIYLDNTVFKGFRMQRILYVTSSGNIQLIDDVQSRASKHLILLVPQCLGRSNYDGVSGVNANRIDVLHITYGDAVAVGIAHYLILDFLPACDTALYQHLSHTAQTKSVGKNVNQLLLIVGDTTAASAQRKSRTKHHRITDGIGKFDTVLHGIDHLGSRTRLSDLLHGVLKRLTILRLEDGLCCRTDQLHAMLLQETGLCQFHTEVQACLSTQSRQNTVGLFLQNNFLQDIHSQRLNIYLIRYLLVRHDGCRIRIHQTYLNALFLQRAARLCSCIVKLCSLSDDDWTGTDY